MSQLYSNEKKLFYTTVMKENPSWGKNGVYTFTTSKNRVFTHRQLADIFKPKSILDFGCGSGLILEDFKNITVEGYDPFVEQFAQYPYGSYDLIISRHAFQHVEDLYFDETLKLLKESCNKYLVATFIIEQYKNRNFNWYLDKFQSYFDVYDYFVGEPHTRAGYKKNQYYTANEVTIWCRR